MDRLTPRQVVVIIARHSGDIRLASLARDLGPARVDGLLLAALRDTIAAAVRVDGATIAVVAPEQRALDRLRQILPAGIDLTAPPESVPAGTVGRFALAHHQGLGFERIVILDACVLRLTSRVIGTALSALATADVVTGSDLNGSDYVFGTLTRHAPVILASGLSLPLAGGSDGDPAGRLGLLQLQFRRLESLPTLMAFGAVDELRAALHGRDGTGRHVTAFLSETPASSPVDLNANLLLQ